MTLDELMCRLTRWVVTFEATQHLIGQSPPLPRAKIYMHGFERGSNGIEVGTLEVYLDHYTKTADKSLGDSVRYARVKPNVSQSWSLIESLRRDAGAAWSHK